MNGTNRIVLNTLLLYTKAGIILLISLYSTRIVLNTLGIIDYGLFNLIGGLVVSLSFLNATLSTATQRFISFNKGTKNIEIEKKIFSNSFILHLGISFLVVFLLETVGIYFLNHKLQIPADRIYESNFLFHFVVLTAFITIISVPYDAVLFANENILFLSILGVLESFLKLLTIVLIAFLDNNKLVTYGFILLLVAIFITISKIVYVKKKYRETNVNFINNFDKTTCRDLTSYASWNLFGVLSYLGKTEGLVILFNIFMGVLINAAYAISIQVTSQINMLSIMMFQAVNPQIVKSEGADNREKMISLVFSSSKFGFFLLSIVAIPVIFEINQILALWLVEVPDFTAVICIYVLLGLLVNQLTAGIDSAMHASGNIKTYMIVVGLIKLVVLPVGYILLKLNYTIHHVFFIYIFLEAFGGLAKLFIMNLKLGISVKNYWNNVILKSFKVIVIVVVINFLFVHFFDFQFRFFITVLLSMIVFIISAYNIALDKSEKAFVKSLIYNISSKINIYKELYRANRNFK